MSDYYDDEDDARDEKQTNTLRDLRKALKAQKDKNAELSDSLDELKEELTKATRKARSFDVQDVLADLKVVNPAKVSRLVPGDVKADKEAIQKWLDDFKDVIPLAVSKTEESASGDSAEGDAPKVEGQANVPEAVRRVFERAERLQTVGVPETGDRQSKDMEALIKAAQQSGNTEQLMGAIRTLAGSPAG